MDGDDVEAHIRRPRLSRRQRLWLIRSVFLLFAYVIAFTIGYSVARRQWLPVALLVGLLVSVPAIARLAEYGDDL